MSDPQGDPAQRKICIHGHFYQPPRDNPWLEQIERQPGAAPYHDWNERIAHECYAANAAARILDDDEFIVDIVNNYERISFNIGPTLMRWLREHRRAVYDAILRADERSIERFGGHGNAIAQAYNHLIMPLANLRDRRTQVEWAIRDFEHHFGRQPEGMWLPEAAVDIDTLESLAQYGIDFTVLAPRQAEAVREVGSDAPWTSVSELDFDTTRAYRHNLPSGRSITLFFYDADVSQAVAFERLLERGEFLASRLMHGFSDRTGLQLVNIATDGETYGHHHHHGEMALAYSLRQIQQRKDVALTNYGQFLEENPPKHEVRIVDHSSWSCVHGVERWRSDCGCQTGGPPDWSQAWRAPLRQALDALRDELGTLFESNGRRLFKEPWSARNEYLELEHIREPGPRRRAITSLMSIDDPTDEQVQTALELMEMQRHSMLMFTSCGWFFNDVAGIETAQILQYAARALELAERIEPNANRRARFLEKLEHAESNQGGIDDARQVLEDMVEPMSLGLTEAARHFALTVLFRHEVDCRTNVPFVFELIEEKSIRPASTRIVGGIFQVTSTRTLETLRVRFVATHLGDHNVLGGIEFIDEEASDSESLLDEARELFRTAEVVELVRWIDSRFDDTFDLRCLIGEVQERVVDWLLESVVTDAVEVHEALYLEHGPLLRFLAATKTQPPKVFEYAAELVLNGRLEQILEGRDSDLELLDETLAEFQESQISLDRERLRTAAAQRLHDATERLRSEPTSVNAAQNFAMICEIIEKVPLDISLWEARNLCFQLITTEHSEVRDGAETWKEAMEAAAQRLNIRVGLSA